MAEETQNQEGDNGSSLIASLEAASNPEKPYLGDFQAVEDMIRQLAAEVFSIMTNPELDKAASQKAFDDEIDKVARAFVGQNPDYSAMPDWHAQGQLARVLARNFEYSDKDPKEIMKAHFNAFGVQVLDITQKALEDDADWQEDFDMLMENFLPTLQGERVAFY